MRVTKKLLLCFCLVLIVVADSSAAVKSRKVMEYDDTNWEDEISRLDYLGNLLRSEPNSLGYIIVYGGRRGRRDYAKKRAACIEDYMRRRLGFNKDRVKVINGGYREGTMVEMWIVPSGECAPKATPTVAPKEVKFTKRGKEYHCEI